MAGSARMEFGEYHRCAALSVYSGVDEGDGLADGGDGVPGERDEFSFQFAQAGSGDCGGDEAAAASEGFHVLGMVGQEDVAFVSSGVGLLQQSG